MLEFYQDIQHHLNSLQTRISKDALHYDISDLSYLKDMTKAQLFTFLLSQAFFAVDFMVDSLRKELIDDNRGWGQAKFLQDQKVYRSLDHIFPDEEDHYAWTYFAKGELADIYVVHQRFLGTFVTTDRRIVLGQVLKKEGDVDILEEYDTQLRSLSMLYAEHFFKEFFPGEPADKLAAVHILLHLAQDLWELWADMVSYMYCLINQELWEPATGRECLMFRLEDYFGPANFGPTPLY